MTGDEGGGVDATVDVAERGETNDECGNDDDDVDNDDDSGTTKVVSLRDGLQDGVVIVSLVEGFFCFVSIVVPLTLLRLLLLLDDSTPHDAVFVFDFVVVFFDLELLLLLLLLFLALPPPKKESNDVCCIPLIVVLPYFVKDCSYRVTPCIPWRSMEDTPKKQWLGDARRIKALAFIDKKGAKRMRKTEH